MLLREIKYYFMTTKQMSKEIERIKAKLESTTNFDKKMRYYEALADMMKVIIVKYQDNEVVMAYINRELNKLRTAFEVNA